MSCLEMNATMDFLVLWGSFGDEGVDLSKFGGIWEATSSMDMFVDARRNWMEKCKMSRARVVVGGNTTTSTTQSCCKIASSSS